MYFASITLVENAISGQLNQFNNHPFISFIHVEKWPNILLKSCGVNTITFLKYVWQFFNNTLHDRYFKIQAYGWELVRTGYLIKIESKNNSTRQVNFSQKSENSFQNSFQNRSLKTFFPLFFKLAPSFNWVLETDLMFIRTWTFIRNFFPRVSGYSEWWLIWARNWLLTVYMKGLTVEVVY